MSLFKLLRLAHTQSCLHTVTVSTGARRCPCSNCCESSTHTQLSTHCHRWCRGKEVIRCVKDLGDNAESAHEMKSTELKAVDGERNI